MSSTITTRPNPRQATMPEAPRGGRRGRCPGARPFFGGGERIRTVDLLLAKQALSQLSYTPRNRGRLSGHGGRRANIPASASEARRLNWWAGEDLNLRPHAYQARALTS